ncbi:MAG: hypothetical protein ACK4RZ_09195 [Paracoccaceae bacterium]
MRLIFLLLGIAFVGIATVIGFGQMHRASDDPAWASSRVPAQDAPSGPATRQLEQAIADAQTDEPLSQMSNPGLSGPRISLGPRGKGSGARFVKPPSFD